MSDELFLSIVELGAAYRNGTLSPMGVTRLALERIRSFDRKLNSFTTVLEAHSVKRAALADHELKSGNDRGPLHGVPIAIKDLVDMAGVPTSFASRAGSPKLPAQDARVVRRLEEAGAVILGKTNLLEYAYGAVHPEFGQTNNPWDLSRTSGGSSGGSAAAVAAGFCFAALGTDTGGSIRIPAAYCGVVGMKPTFGLVEIDGVQPLSWSLDHVGPLARSCGDAALFLEAMTGKPCPIAASRVQDLRIGILQDEGAEQYLQPGVAARFEVALDRLIASGATIRRVEIADLNLAPDALLTIIGPEASVVHQRLIAAEPEKFGENTRRQIEAGFAIPATAYLRAQMLQQELQRRFRRLFDDVDAVLSPAVPWVAPAEDPALNDQGGSGEMLYSAVYNLVGLPALVVPMGMTDEGMPTGLQIATPWGAENLAFAIGSFIEAGHYPLRPSDAVFNK
jgi:aspartyl-tRNA(Asn)/glutamyl-tRNA(Gln) amidotransferase subunit A